MDHAVNWKAISAIGQIVGAIAVVMLEAFRLNEAITFPTNSACRSLIRLAADATYDDLLGVMVKREDARLTLVK